MQIIKNNDSIFEKYLRDLKRYEPLTKEEEEVLKSKITKGDDKAKEELYLRHLRFVVHQVMKFTHSDKSKEFIMDLISEGNMALIEAISNFDETINIRFMTFAVKFINIRILNHIKVQTQQIRLPNQYNPENSIRYPKCFSISETLNFDENNIEDIEYINDSEFSESNNLITNQMNKELYRLINNELVGKEQDIIIKYYGLNNTKRNLKELSEEYKLTEVRIMQIRDTALKKIRRKAIKLLEIKTQ